MKSRFLLLSFAVLLVAAACAPPPNLRNEELLQDTSLLSGEPCEAPCWRGIVPGETSWSEAVIIVEDDPTLSDVEEVEDPESDQRVLNFSADGGPQCCRLFTEDGQMVDAILTLLAPQMSLSEVIDKFGEPTYVTGDDVTSDQTLLLLVYPDVPLVVYAFAAGVEEGELAPNSEIIGAIYIDEEGMQDLLRSTDLYNWEGYRPLAGYIDENFDVTAVESEQGSQDNVDVETE